MPDKRYTFDFRRPSTPLEHMVADHELGPERSRRAHYEEWAKLVIPEEGEPERRVIARARQIERGGYSIHMHAWTQAGFLELVLDCRRRFGDGFEIEAAARQGIEFVVVLRKRGPWPRAAISGEARRRLQRLWASSRRRCRLALRRLRRP